MLARRILLPLGKPPRAAFKVDLSRGERVGRVSSEWFSRPDDERFLSLPDLYAAVRARANCASARTVESRAVRVEASRDDAGRPALIVPRRADPVVPTDWSFGYLCSLVGAPSGYLRELPPALAGINLLEWTAPTASFVPSEVVTAFGSWRPSVEQINRIGMDTSKHVFQLHKSDERSQRLAKIPGVGPIGAALLTMKTPAPQLFQSGRQFAAWIGLTPKDHSTGGKVRLGVITRAGDEKLRSILVAGATAVIQQAQRNGKMLPWVTELLKRKPPKLAAVALANKTDRIAWKLMSSGESYKVKSALTTLSGAV